MSNEELSKRLGRLGFPLLKREESFDANATLAEVLQSKELRYWEAFPVLLANSAERGFFDYQSVRMHLAEAEQESFDRLLFMSLCLYKVLGLKFSWSTNLSRQLPFTTKEYQELVQNLKKGKEFKVGDRLMSPERLTNTFQNYFRQEEGKVTEFLSQREELELEYSLSQVFSPRQKELFWKKLKGEKLSKTEKEYFSRRVKKKVLALANERLHQLAKSL